MKAICVGDGEKCQRCKRHMKRYRHGQNWKPKHSQPYYFDYWDKCQCGMLQHYEAAKISLVPIDDLEKEYRSIFSQPS